MDKNSMLYWWPKIKDLGIPVPKTEILEIPKGYQKIYPGEDTSELKKYEDRIYKLADRMGYPLFLRTDQSSAKHDWTETCYVEKRENLMNNVIRLIEENSCADLMGLPWEALIFREFLELKWNFVSFYKDFPVSRERRYFVNNGEIQCKHHYWFEDAIERGYHNTPLPDNWKKLLMKLNRVSVDESIVLEGYAKKVAGNIEGYWSVDFAQTKEGTWYLIDMATGQRSFHHFDCPYCPEEIKRQYGKSDNDEI